MPTSIWSLNWNAPPVALTLAREAGSWLLRDGQHWLTLFNRNGQRQAQFHRPTRLTASTASEDGSAFLAIDGFGTIVRLGPDLNVVWERRLGGKWLAGALDATGDYALISESTSKLLLLDRGGEAVREFHSPRPGHHLALVPNAPLALVAADFGFVGCLRLSDGTWLWRDSPVVYHGSLSVAGSGEPAVVACFSDGLRSYRREGKAFPWPMTIPPCRFACCSVDGQLLVVAGVDQRIQGWDRSGRKVFAWEPSGDVAGLALSALGETVVVAYADHRLVAYSVGLAVA